jgi:hypothetical protein
MPNLYIEYIDQPSSILYVVKGRIEHTLRTAKNIHDKEIELLEDEVLPAIDKYLKMVDELPEEVIDYELVRN